MKKYLPVFIIFIAVIAGATFFFIGNETAETKKMTWMVFTYFSLLTLIFHFGIVKTTESRPAVFIRYYMATTTMKLLLHLVVIVAYAVFHREEAMRFIITFMIMYFLFTIFEVVYVARRNT